MEVEIRVTIPLARKLPIEISAECIRSPSSTCIRRVIAPDKRYSVREKLGQRLHRHRSDNELPVLQREAVQNRPKQDSLLYRVSDELQPLSHRRVHPTEDARPESSLCLFKLFRDMKLSFAVFPCYRVNPPKTNAKRQRDGELPVDET